MVNSVGSSANSNLAQYASIAKRPEPPNTDDLFKKLSADVGGDGKTITKEQLDSYIEKIEKEGGTDDKKLEMLKKLSENFSQIAGDDGQLTVDELKKDMEAHKPPKPSQNSDKDPQDPSSITKDQLEPPIDIRI